MPTLNLFGEGATFHHVGLVVRSIEKIVDQSTPIWQDEQQQVKIALIDLDGAPIELIEPMNPQSPVTRSLRENHRLLHLCYAVPDIDAAIIVARRNGFHCIAHPVPATAFHQRRITWLFSQDYGLIELVEAREESPEQPVT